MRASLSPVRKGAMCGGSMDACGCCIPDGSSASGHKTKRAVRITAITADSNWEGGGGRKGGGRGGGSDRRRYANEELNLVVVVV